MNYKEIVLRCFEEGYDAGKLNLSTPNPYDYTTHYYEYKAWEVGNYWYISMVH